MFYHINRYCYRLGRILGNFEGRYETVEEIKNHLEEYACRLIEKGVTEERAVRLAIRSMGNVYAIGIGLNICHRKNIKPEINTDGYFLRHPITAMIFSAVGLDFRDTMRYIAVSLFMVLVIVSFLIFKSRNLKIFKMYGLSDVYSFGKIYHIEQPEKEVTPSGTSCVYSSRGITPTHIRRYKELLEEQGYTETDENTFTNNKGRAVDINKNDESIIITLHDA